MRALRVLGRSLLDFFRDDGLMLAGSMSYFTMMALVPFFLFIMTLFGYLLGRYPEFYNFISSRIDGVFPSVTGQVTHELVKLISYKGIGKVSILLYGFLSYQVFGSMEHALNVIFRVKNKRRVIFSVLISLLVVTLVMALLILSFAASSAAQLLPSLRYYFPGIKVGGVMGFIIGFVVPFILMLLTVTALYKLLPRAKVRFSSAFEGALFTVVFLELAKHVFTWYVVSVAHFGRIYGSLTAIVVFLLWMFYSSCIFLVGAEIVRNLGSPRKA
ncbi:MAG: YihY/virulence factor BrkB family protein [Nitrospiraceae bacterium]|nr:YihY/virulence factor BrkB family protein [Nitrospiraceae bacterium]